MIYNSNQRVTPLRLACDLWLFGSRSCVQDTSEAFVIAIDSLHHIAITLTDTAQYEPQRIPGYAPSIKNNPQ